MGAWQEIVDFSVATSTQEIVFDSFGEITEDDFIKIIVTHVNGSGSESSLSVFPNTTASVSGYNTTSNYTIQTLQGAGSDTPSAVRFAGNLIGGPGGNATNYSLLYFKLSENGKANFFTNTLQVLSTLVRTSFWYTTSHNLTFNDAITSFTFRASQASGIGTGSRIQIYKLAATKVADITVASNSTQVNIPFPTGTFDPAIDKDSEYLLVSDVIETVFNLSINLFPNGLTTATGYHSQRIFGSGSTAGASRINNARFISGEDIDKRSLAHTHIKLSNIGAFTAQSYQIRKYGESTVDLLNMFVSSTAENITSITELNIVASGTNGIKAGSRFILYKLYE